MPINIKESIKNLGSTLEWLAFIENEEAMTTFTDFISQKKVGYLCMHTSDLSSLPTWISEGIQPNFIVMDILKLDAYTDLPLIMENIPKEVQVIALGSRDNLGYYRQLQKIGIREYLFIPINGSLLEEVYKKLTASVGTSSEPKCIGVMGARGGTGVTTVTTNLAFLWHEVTKERCCILDFDPQSGDVSAQLNLPENNGLHDVLSNMERVDEALLKSLMIEKYPGLSVITNDWALTGAFSNLSLSELTFTNLFHLLYQEVDTLFLDLSSQTSMAQLELLLPQLTQFVWVTDLSLSAIRDTLLRFSWLQTQAVNGASLTVIVNTSRPLTDTKIAFDTLKQSLNYPIQTLLPFCKDMQKSIIDGEIYAKSYPQKPFTELLRITIPAASAHSKTATLPSLWQKIRRSWK